MQKTVVVAIEMPKKHGVYGKTIKSTKRLKARTEQELKIGAEVRICERAPLSKEVKWEVVEVL